MTTSNSFGSRASLAVDGRSYVIHRLDALANLPGNTIASLPFSLKILLENLLRQEDGVVVKDRKSTRLNSSH